MSETKTYKLRPGRPPVRHIPNEDEFFEKKAAKMKALLEKYPVPEELLRREK
ncbi:hypothetical protein SAMN04487996_105211 [Dyadobacter soli]|uniref:Uncharacterized protein n=1 Tax=Dyadobacter soli TaxID=659014 RepID=A0A1G7DEA4_9BACT|nr:hypothetical protein [Dyadobacter soli]SDE49924.1 hypothetical protein SAMN04487996_105211 [Dyadobacter soli]